MAKSNFKVKPRIDSFFASRAVINFFLDKILKHILNVELKFLFMYNYLLHW